MMAARNRAVLVAAYQLEARDAKYMAVAGASKHETVR